MDAWNWCAFQPAGLEHADLREPLREEEVATDRAGPGEGARHLGGPLDLEIDRIAGAHLDGERDADHGLVVHVAVVGLDEVQLRGEVHGGRGTGAEEAQGATDGHVREVLERPVRADSAARGRRQEALPQERRAGVLPGVPVEVQANLVRGPGVMFRHVITSRPVMVRARDVQRRVDRVVGVSRRACADGKGRGVAQHFRRSGLRRGHCGRGCGAGRARAARF